MTDGMERTWLKHYAEGVPADVDPSDASLVDLFDTSVERFGSLVALEFFGAETTFAELGQQVRAAAEGLRQLGVGAGDRVAIVLPNCPEHIVAFHAVLRLGAVVVEHNPLYTSTRDGAPAERPRRDGRHRLGQGRWPRRDGGSVSNVVVGRPDDGDAAGRTRLALRLPIAKARTSRAALTAPAPGTTRGGLLAVTRRARLRLPAAARVATSPRSSTRAARPVCPRARC